MTKDVGFVEFRLTLADLGQVLGGYWDFWRAGEDRFHKCRGFVFGVARLVGETPRVLVKEIVLAFLFRLGAFSECIIFGLLCIGRLRTEPVPELAGFLWGDLFGQWHGF